MKHKSVKSLSLILSFLGVFILSFAYARANDWQNMQFPTYNNHTQHVLSVTADVNGIPYIAFTDADLGGKVRIKKYENSVLTEVGSMGSLNYTDGEIMINPISNQLYFLSNYEDGVYLLKFNGSDWEAVGNNLCDYDGKLDFDPASGAPYVACSQDEGVLAKKFNGSSWEDVGNYVTDEEVYNLDIAFNPISREPYVIYSAENLENVGVSVKKYSGGNWVSVGPAYFDDVYEYGDIKIMLDEQENPYISYFTYAGSHLAGHLKKFAGGSWSEVGDTGFLNYASDIDDLFLDFSISPKNNQPWLFNGAYKAYSQDGYSHIRKYNGSSWVVTDTYVQSQSWIKNSGSKNGKIAFSKTGDAFVGFDYYAFTNNMSYWEVYFQKNSYIESNKKSLASGSKTNPIKKKQIKITVPQVSEKTQKKWVTVRFNNRKVTVLRAANSGGNLVVTVAMKYKKWTKGYYNLTLSYKYKSGKRILSKTVTSPSFLYIY